MPRTALAFLLLGWCGWALVREGARAVSAAPHRRAVAPESSFFWRFGSPPVEELRRCALEASRMIPAGAKVALGDPQDDFFRWRWAAYYLPGNDVVGARQPEAVDSEFLLEMSDRVPPFGTRVGGRPGCTVYFLPPPTVTQSR